MVQAPIPSTTIRQVNVAQTLHWLVLGMRDLTELRWISLAHGLVLTLVGGCITLVAHDRFWLLAGALSGFLLMAPVLADILKCAPGAIAATKALIAKARFHAPASLVQEAAEVFSRAALGPEGVEGTTAFLQKRKARWVPQ